MTHKTMKSRKYGNLLKKSEKQANNNKKHKRIGGGIYLPNKKNTIFMLGSVTFAKMIGFG